MKGEQENHGVTHLAILKSEPRFENLRADPRFSELLKKMNLMLWRLQWAAIGSAFSKSAARNKPE